MEGNLHYTADYDDHQYADFSTRSPRHRSLTAPDRARAKRKSFRKRAAPCPIRGIAHRRNNRLDW